MQTSSAPKATAHIQGGPLWASKTPPFRRPLGANQSLSPVVVVVDRRLGGLGLRARLVVVHLCDLRGVGRVLRPLVLPRADEAREAQRDTLSRIDHADGGGVHGRDGEVGREHLPHLLGLKPHVGRREVAALGQPVVLARLRDDVLVEALGQLLQRLGLGLGLLGFGFGLGSGLGLGLRIGSGVGVGVGVGLTCSASSLKPVPILHMHWYSSSISL